MTLAALIKRRDELRTRSVEVDRAAGPYREADLPLPESVRKGFAVHDELRRVEREIAKLKERK